MTPMQPEDTDFFTAIAIKIVGVFVTFISGVVTATWVVAGKIRGYDVRMQAIEKLQEGCPGRTLDKMDAKLDRIHERIDEILLNGKHHE